MSKARWPSGPLGSERVQENPRAEGHRLPGEAPQAEAGSCGVDYILLHGEVVPGRAPLDSRKGVALGGETWTQLFKLKLMFAFTFLIMKLCMFITVKLESRYNQ